MALDGISFNEDYGCKYECDDRTWRLSLWGIGCVAAGVTEFSGRYFVSVCCAGITVDQQPSGRGKRVVTDYVDGTLHGPMKTIGDADGTLYELWDSAILD
jgi:hypothetical protein